MDRKVITNIELERLQHINSTRLPKIISKNGRRYEWIGIGWIDAGLEKGDEVVIVVAR